MSIENPNYYWEISKDRKTVTIRSARTGKIVTKEDVGDMLDRAFQDTDYGAPSWLGGPSIDDFYWVLSKDRKTMYVRDKKTKRAIEEEDVEEMIDYAFRHTDYTYAR